MRHHCGDLVLQLNYISILLYSFYPLLPVASCLQHASLTKLNRLSWFWTHLLLILTVVYFLESVFLSFQLINTLKPLLDSHLSNLKFILYEVALFGCTFTLNHNHNNHNQWVDWCHPYLHLYTSQHILINWHKAYTLISLFCVIVPSSGALSIVLATLWVHVTVLVLSSSDQPALLGKGTFWCSLNSASTLLHASISFFSLLSK